MRAAQPQSGAQEFLRIDGVAVHARLVVQMRPGRAPGRADLADDLAGAHPLPDLDVIVGQMPVAGREPVAVVDLDHLAVAALPAGDRDVAVGGRAHRIAGLAAEIQAGVHRGRADERIDAHAEAGGYFHLAHDRLAHRHRRERARQPVDLGAGDADAVDVLLERSGIGRQPCWHQRAADAGIVARADAHAVEPEIGQHAADALRLGFVALLHRCQRCRLPRLDAIERRLQARERAGDAVAAGAIGQQQVR